MVLCQFVHYLIQNSIHFLPDTHLLYSYLSNHLHHLTTTFRWADNKSLSEMQAQYILPEHSPKITAETYRKLYHCLKETVRGMAGEGREDEAGL